MLQSNLAGRYLVEGLVGEGGMAFVFKAHDVKHDRPVALKVLRPEVAEALGEERFTREIRFAARLQHPNILPLYDSGSVAGQLFYVMPFVEGESLRQRLEREKQLPVEDVIRIGSEVADALEFAHQHGVIHRDIKPDNLLMVGGHTLVADFGIAKAITAAGGTALTSSGMVVGTPVYMSPEQAGGAENVDPRSDMYSLACVLYEALVGSPPFSGSTPQALLARHSLDRVPSIRVVRQTIPDALEAAILKALEKVPADRYASMAQFASALTAGTHGPPTGASPTAPSVLPWKVSRSVLGMALGAALVLIVILGRGRFGSGGHAVTAADQGAHRLAVLYFDTPGDQDSLRYVADALTEGLIDQLRLVSGLEVVSRGGVAAYRGAAIPRDSVGRMLDVGTLVEGEVESRPDGLHLTVRLVDAVSNAEFRRKGFVFPGQIAVTILDSATSAVAEFLRARLGEEITIRQRQAGTRNPSAWAYLQRGLVTAKRADSLARFGAGTVSPESGLAPHVAETYLQSDSLLMQARAADPGWIEPLLALAANAYARSRNVNADPVAARPWILRAVSFSDSAIRLDKENAEAHEIRGTAEYWGYLLDLDQPDTAASGARLRRARQDLERAVALEPHRAGAWASLASLHYQEGMGGVAEALLAARRAYDEDAFLSNASVVLRRLFNGAYDTGNLADAEHWCSEGGRRFPAEFKFVECRLVLMTMPGATADPVRARLLEDSALARAPKPDSVFQKAALSIWMAGVLARAGLADSARRVLEATRIDPEIDPQGELYLRAAFVLTLLGDRDQAYQALRTRMAMSPKEGIDLHSGWWFSAIADDPRFAELGGGGR